MTDQDSELFQQGCKQWQMPCYDMNTWVHILKTTLPKRQGSY